MLPVDPLASIPFQTTDAIMELVKDNTLEARRVIAANLTEETIRALRRRPDPRTPDLTLMQTLYDSGIRQCPMSGTPVFDPSKLNGDERAILWRAYCGIALAIDDPAQAQDAVAAIDAIRVLISNRATRCGSNRTL